MAAHDTRPKISVLLAHYNGKRYIEELASRGTLSEARVVIEDWRWKYNYLRPHRSLGYITPLEFAHEKIEGEPPTQCWASGRATPSLRPSIDLLYNLEHIINPTRLTKALAQFGQLDQSTQNSLQTGTITSMESRTSGIRQSTICASLTASNRTTFTGSLRSANGALTQATINSSLSNLNTGIHKLITNP
jgi:hypothetical protein